MVGIAVFFEFHAEVRGVGGVLKEPEPWPRAKCALGQHLRFSPNGCLPAPDWLGDEEAVFVAEHSGENILSRELHLQVGDEFRLGHLGGGLELGFHGGEG